MKYIEQIKAYTPINDQEINDKKVILDFINESDKNLLTRENGIAHFTSSGFVVNKTCDKILMIHHKIYDTWTWTGGHADGEEDMLATAIKEAQEESGIMNLRPVTEAIHSIDILPVWGHVRRGKYVSAHLHLNASYVLIGDENEQLTINEEETHGVKWISVADMPEASKEPELIVVYNKLLDFARNELGLNN